MQLSSFKNKKNALKDTKYFIPCYDIIKNEIYFSEFFTEEIISKTEKELDEEKILIKIKEENKSRKRSSTKIMELEKKNLIQKKLDELNLNEFVLRFKKMQIISRFNMNHYISEEYKNYFSRPLFSHFFHPQNIDLYSSNDNRTMNNISSPYSYVDFSIEFHLDSLLGLNLDNYFQEMNQSHNNDVEGEGNNISNISEDNEPNQYYLQLNNDIAQYTYNK